MDKKFKKGDHVLSRAFPNLKHLVVAGVFAKFSEWWYLVDDLGDEEPYRHELPESDLTMKNEESESNQRANIYRASIECLLDRQEKKGLEKYGVTLDENKTLTTKQRIEHLQEELVDGLMYCEHLKFATDSQGITADDYQRAALRTAQVDSMSVDELLLNGVMGLCGEAGEVIDLVKKTRFQGHGMDYDALKKELGDVAWYLAIASYAAGFKLSAIMERNIEKLKERYPEGFDKSRSIHRKENTSEDNGPGFAD